MELAKTIVRDLNNLHNRSSAIDQIAHGYTATQNSVVYQLLVTEQDNSPDSEKLPYRCPKCTTR